ncbi:MAG: AMP-binding protein, partial [Planctomycetales bacterium]
KKVADKLNMNLDAEMVYLEDLLPKATMGDKAFAALLTYAMPSAMTERMLGLHKIQPDDPLTIIFTSGSTGEPKGVVLTYANIGSNIAAMDQMVDLRSTDVVLGVLPFFHSFGLTGNLWCTLALDPMGVFHFSPLDARQIGKLCEKHKGSILMATPTFLRSYLRRCTPEQFKSLELIITGAEKLPAELIKAFQEKFGSRPYEAYGTTELSPLVSVNLPDARALGNVQKCSKDGTVGRPVVGTVAKVVHLEDGTDLGVDESGMLLIKGPNVMKGYLGRPELTAEKIQDGWYVTGDVAQIDEEGFITITGRISRFSKIGGEMVPHIMVEEMIGEILGNEEELLAAVAAVPDEKKGERLIVLHRKIDKTPEEIRKGLSEAGLANLWIPSVDSFVEIEEIPILGSGKLALGELKEIALERFGQPAAQAGE